MTLVGVKMLSWKYNISQRQIKLLGWKSNKACSWKTSWGPFECWLGDRTRNILQALRALESLCSEFHISISTLWLPSLCIVRKGINRQGGRRPQKVSVWDKVAGFWLNFPANTARSMGPKFVILLCGDPKTLTMMCHSFLCHSTTYRCHVAFTENKRET